MLASVDEMSEKKQIAGYNFSSNGKRLSQLAKKTELSRFLDHINSPSEPD
jgi:hypothetical protein